MHTQFFCGLETLQASGLPACLLLATLCPSFTLSHMYSTCAQLRSSCSWWTCSSRALSSPNVHGVLIVGSVQLAGSGAG